MIRKLEPSVVYRLALRAGDGVSVRVTYDGVPTRAAFRVDAGEWTALELAGAVKGPATAQVTVPASAFLQSRGKVDLQLANAGGESIAAIQVLSAPAGPGPTDAELAGRLQGALPGALPGGSAVPGTPNPPGPEAGSTFRPGPRPVPRILPR